jgi:hypothetical protein
MLGSGSRRSNLSSVYIALIALTLLLGQAPAAQGSIFPDDGEKPNRENSREWLEAVCPGRVEMGDGIGCGKYCPPFTGMGQAADYFDGWSLSSITRGHFLSPTRRESKLPNATRSSSGARVKFWYAWAGTEGKATTRPHSDDAVIATSGCEPHTQNFGGTILLTRKAGRWTMLWYKGAIVLTSLLVDATTR